MNQSKISVRYAKALLLSAKEQNLLAPVYNDITSLFNLFSTSTDLAQVFSNPVVKPSVKIKIVKELGRNTNAMVQSFMVMVINNGRENQFVQIFRNFISFYKAEMGIKSAHVTSVFPIDKKNLENIRTILSEYFNCTIEIAQHSDPNLIGGFIIRIDTMQLDKSVSSELKKIKRELTSETYKSKL